MDHYLDIRIMSDPEFAPELLMSALFGKLHQSLVRLKRDDIGLTFPDYDSGRRRLGLRMRLHASAAALSELSGTSWLNGIRDHVQLSGILPAPVVDRFCRVQRVQCKSNVERIRRRQMRRHGYSEEEAAARVPESASTLLELPFLSLRSGSTGQLFRLFIRQSEAAALNEGRFNAYGLSYCATLPFF